MTTTRDLREANGLFIVCLVFLVCVSGSEWCSTTGHENLLKDAHAPVEN